MCVFCKVLLIPNFNFLREKYGDTLMKNELHGCWAIFRRLPTSTSSAIPMCHLGYISMCKSFRIAVIFRKPLNLTQTKKCQGRQPRGAQIFPGGLSPPPWLRACVDVLAPNYGAPNIRGHRWKKNCYFVPSKSFCYNEICYFVPSKSFRYNEICYFVPSKSFRSNEICYFVPSKCHSPSWMHWDWIGT